jgi:hypothetical protein
MKPPSAQKVEQALGALKVVAIGGRKDEAADILPELATPQK